MIAMEKKNILIFVLDQLAWRALDIHGGFAAAPNIAKLAQDGVDVDECYCPYPLCQPSRASFWTGKFSHRNRVWSNGRKWKITEIGEDVPTLGSVFSEHGYQTMHFGKKHDGGALRGFWCDEEKEKWIADENPAFPFNMDTYADAYTVERSVDYLSSYSYEKPLMMVVDLINPHNICGWIGKNRGVHDDVPFSGALPELPPNYHFDDIANRPIPVQYLCCSHVRQSQTVGWTDMNFRHYLAAYSYYLGIADSYIGRVLEALDKSGGRDDTLIVLFSDHGDNITSRQSVTKQVTLYEEVVRVPLIFSGCKVGRKGVHVKGLASLLDLFPTLCSYASIPVPEGLDGMDISSIFSSGDIPKREYVESEWFTEWGYTISPGRMIRSGQWKYIRYLEGDGEELYDLQHDPYEMRNLAGVAEYFAKKEMMRALLAKHLDKTDDPFLSLNWKASPKWRSHELGYQCHRGITAPEDTEEQ